MNEWDEIVEATKREVLEKGTFSGNASTWQMITAMGKAIHELNDRLSPPEISKGD